MNFEQYAAQGQRDAFFLAKIAKSLREIFGEEPGQRMPPPVPAAAARRTPPPVAPVSDVAKRRAMSPVTPLPFVGKKTAAEVFCDIVARRK